MVDVSKLLSRKFRFPTGPVRHDSWLARRGTGPNSGWNPITVERQITEQCGLCINAVLRRYAPTIRERFIRERLSANFPTHQRGRGGGVRWIKLPLSAGLRKKTGNLQRSVRMTVTSPGTTASRFRGVFRLSSKVGGGPVQYAHRHENEGRMQFGRVTQEEYAKAVAEIKAGITQIVAPFGGKVSF